MAIFLKPCGTNELTEGLKNDLIQNRLLGFFVKNDKSSEFMIFSSLRPQQLKLTNVFAQIHSFKFSTHKRSEWGISERAEKERTWGATQ